jgi:hypothetical protein
MTQSRRLYPPRATDARFVRAGEGQRGHTHVQVSGEHFVPRGVPLLARLGNQPLVAIVLRNGGEGFAGIAERAPQDGDRLFVGYADGPLAATDVVYRAHAEPPTLV